MTTSFTGTKILKYPYPRVTSPLAFLGIDGLGDITNKTEGELVALSQAVYMSIPRLSQLNSVYGIDISYAQGDGKGNSKINWKELVNNPKEGDPNVEFAIIKVSQKDFRDSTVVSHATNATKYNLKIGYYHFGEPYSGSDVVGNATSQAEYFVNSISALNLPKPDFPLILDMENHEAKNKYWSGIKKNNDLWINTFVNVVKSKGYEVMLYGNAPFFKEYTSNNFGSIPLWHAAYPPDPERSNPKIANGWKDWSIWQFSSNGRLSGYNGRLDINAMRKDFFKKA
jgi:lysozyme